MASDPGDLSGAWMSVTRVQLSGGRVARQAGCLHDHDTPVGELTNEELLEFGSESGSRPEKDDELAVESSPILMTCLAENRRCSENGFGVGRELKPGWLDQVAKKG